jgi:radical SAM superfamily enzyme YgiQ (UPF0313 family)
MLDVLFVTPGNAHGIYQDLANDYSAIEPPTWALLLAQSTRAQNFTVGILDANAERLSAAAAVERIQHASPRLVCFVVYGQNVNAGTVGMSGAMEIAELLRSSPPHFPICIIGSYVQALPLKALRDEDSIDFVFTNEGVYALINVLALDSFSPKDLAGIRGIAYRSEDGSPIINPAESIVPQSRMDVDLPGYAWDLLPYEEKPFDLYRSPLWHAEYDTSKRSPYAALQTSLGCNYGCSFCMINIINRDDDDEVGVASNYSKMRFWSPKFVIREFDVLASYGVRTIRIVDEMFLLYKKYYVPLCEILSERDYSSELRMWAYSRVDTVTDPELLKLVRRAGIRWLALGIESASQAVRLEVSKGKFQDVDIRRVIQQIHDADIEVMGNYIVGLPGETHETMRQTLDLSKELCTSGWNMYPAMALPGSELYRDAVARGYHLPESYLGYSFHSYDTIPMRTETLAAAEILSFRDEAFLEYHSDTRFLNRVENRFGVEARLSMREMTKVRLRRRICEGNSD